MPKHRRGRRFPVELRESAATAERVEVRESTVAQSLSGGRMLVRLISEGRGSSGTYPASVLERAGAAKVFHRGLPMYIDHSTATEDDERPERSIRDLAAVLTEDARWDPANKALVAEAKVFAPYRSMLADMSEHIGVSIRASGLAEHDARTGDHIVTEIKSARSVDFVTAAGRGGKVLALLESARAELRESPTESTRVLLDHAVRADWGGGEGRYAYVRDFDPDRQLVWFEAGSPGESALWEQPYRTHATGLELYGARQQVVAETVYRTVSVTDSAAPEPTPMAYAESAAEVAALRAQNPDPATEDPGGTPPAETNTTEEEPGMSGTQTGSTPAPAGNAPASTELAEAATARDAALREAEAAKQRADAAELRVARYEAAEKAGPIVDGILAESGLPTAAVTRVRAGVLARVPLAESGALDETALRTLAEAETTAEKAYVAQLAEAAGAGRVSGFGATTAPATQQPGAATGWGAPLPEPDQQLIESYERRGLPRAAAVAAARGRAV